jgi:1,4-alpha-glucan branching enzyme
VLTKNWNAKTGRYDVTFDLPADLDIEQAAVVGEFNDWSESSDPMSKEGDGSWSATVALEPSRSYRFRYHLGEDRWENDWNADRYERNDFGGSDSVVTIPEAPVAPPAAKSAAPKKAAAKKAAPKKAGTAKAPAKKASTTKKAGTTKKAAKKATKRPPA